MFIRSNGETHRNKLFSSQENAYFTNRALTSLHRGSLKITFIVLLRLQPFQQGKDKNKMHLEIKIKKTSFEKSKCIIFYIELFKNNDNLGKLENTKLG